MNVSNNRHERRNLSHNNLANMAPNTDLPLFSPLSARKLSRRDQSGSTASVARCHFSRCRIETVSESKPFNRIQSWVLAPVQKHTTQFPLSWVTKKFLEWNERLCGPEIFSTVLGTSPTRTKISDLGMFNDFLGSSVSDEPHLYRQIDARGELIGSFKPNQEI